MALASTPKPLVVKNLELTVDGTDYAWHVNSAMLTPTTTIATWKGAAAGAVINEATTPTWVLDITYVQDFESSTSLARYLWDNQGDTVAMTFKPKVGSTGFTANVVLIAGGIGGALDTVAVTTSSFPVNGQPVLVPAA